ncbi:glycoside hydrolase family 3 N-terminal domain-containing protein [uncultured Sphaerochaeta sp.]|uniref:glycoside hydrolase family 3 protein n=1 Tax=uncultured Sphaerochaeta sp. TaxID=886478 RepID=UPI002A0A8EA0|nr:glycoside hydrolase family 3 N-terminal domain-containing protein [uncultured Sphaerochaeta sp.]
MGIDLKAKPFFLQDKDCQWVEKTLAGMTVSQKVSQLFCVLIKDEPVASMMQKMEALDFWPGSFMTSPLSSKDVASNFRKLEERARIPLLFACNLERGGDGICSEGTLFGTQMQVAATNDTQWGYELGRVCGEEGLALGSNWNFGPVLDIDTNFHNPITNTRTFGSDPEKVLSFSRAFSKGLMDAGMAVCLKHWPGDGRDERDQHMVATINDCSVEQWDATYGKIYKTLIEDGAQSIMAAHIMVPEYSRELCPLIKDEAILPGSLSYELTYTLLRKRLGFNGLVVTDATTMAGFMQAMPRKEALIKAIASGCDMLLFTVDLQEDFQSVLDGVKNGMVSRERLDDAVTHILALKAHLKVHEKPLPAKKFSLDPLHLEEHEKQARKCADQAITLVKDTQFLLPLSPCKHKRVLLHVLGDKGGYHDPITNTSVHFRHLLEKEGFVVTVFDARDASLLPIGNSVESMTARFDLVIYYASVKTSGSDTVSRITWAAPGGCSTPRYINEIPTMLVSVDSPYMLLDVPRIKTCINGYTPNIYVIEAIVEKLMGRSPFVGVSPVDPFCGLFDARL